MTEWQNDDNEHALTVRTNSKQMMIHQWVEIYTTQVMQVLSQFLCKAHVFHCETLCKVVADAGEALAKSEARGAAREKKSITRVYNGSLRAKVLLEEQELANCGQTSPRVYLMTRGAES